jgi:putative hemolysin
MEFSLLAPLALILLLLYASAWISSAETAFFSLSSHKIRSYETDPDPRKQLIAKLLTRPRDLLVTVFMINTCVNIFLQNITSDLFGPHAGWGLKVGVPLSATLIFGEIIPKYIGMQNNAAISYRVAPMIQKLQNWLSGVRKVIIAITTPISKIMFFFLKKEPTISKEELEHVIETSELHGVLKQGEGELLKGFLHLQEVQAKEIMWPKEDILFYDLSRPLSHLIHLFTEQDCTRIPVCRGSFEDLAGVITVMQFFKNQEKMTKPENLVPFLNKPFFVPETTPARQLLKQMDEAGEILAFIVDEYGSITGMLSREDLIAIVVGCIVEEKGAEALFTPAGPFEVIASGKWDLSEFNDHFQSDLASQNHLVSIGGWLTEQIGDIPQSGSTFDLQGFHFKVLSSSKTRITRLFIRKKGAGK